jgi:phage-related protein
MLIVANTVEKYAAPVAENLTKGFIAAQGWVNAVFGQINSIIQTGFAIILGFLGDNSASISETIGTAWLNISQVVFDAVNIIGPIIFTIFSTIANFLSEHSAQIQFVLTQAWGMISAVIKAVTDVIASVVHAAMQLIQGNWQGAWQTIQNMSVRFLGYLKDFILSALQFIAGLFGTNLESIGKLWESNWRAIVQYFTGLFGPMIKSTVDFFVNLAKQWNDSIEGILAWFNGMPDAFGKVANSIGNSVIEGIKKGIQDAWEGLKSFFQGLMKGLIDSGKDAIESHSPSKLAGRMLGKPIPEGIGEDIEAGMPAVQRTLGRNLRELISSAQPVGGLPTIPQLMPAMAGAMPTGISSQPMGASRASGNERNDGVQIIFKDTVIASDIDIQELGYKIAEIIKRRRRES